MLISKNTPKTEKTREKKDLSIFKCRNYGRKTELRVKMNLIN